MSTKNRMSLANLHLEELVVLPDELEAAIADRRELTPELEEQGMFHDIDKSKNPPQPYNRFFRNYEYTPFKNSEYGPFRVAVAELFFDKLYVFGSDEEVNENTVYYEISFDCSDKEFVPYHRFIREWAKKNSSKGERINLYFGQWLDKQIDDTDYPTDVVGFRLSAPNNQDMVNFWLPGRENFMRLLKDLSAAFRTLAPNASAPTAKDIYDEANEFKVDPEAKPSTAYYDLTNHKLLPLITAGIKEAIEAYKKIAEEAEDCHISVELGTTMKFYFGEDECEGKPFFKFKLGPVHDVSMELQKKMEEQGGTGRSQAVSNLFEDATPGIDESLLEDCNFVLWVPEVGGDPYIEVYNDDEEEDD